MCVMRRLQAAALRRVQQLVLCLVLCIAGSPRSHGLLTPTKFCNLFLYTDMQKRICVDHRQLDSDCLCKVWRAATHGRSWQQAVVRV
jgi:hypothetical protein